MFVTFTLQISITVTVNITVNKTLLINATVTICVTVIGKILLVSPSKGCMVAFTYWLYTDVS